MNLTVTLALALVLSLVGTLIATAIFGIIDGDDVPEAMTGDDYPGTAIDDAER